MQTVDNAKDAADTMAVLAVMQRMQTRCMVSLYTNIPDVCFSACVDTFTSPKLSDRETLCVKRCTEKLTGYIARAQRSFARANLTKEEEEELTKEE
jgi:import inner membrane translocase subunit TIM9